MSFKYVFINKNSACLNEKKYINNNNNNNNNNKNCLFPTFQYYFQILFTTHLNHENLKFIKNYTAKWNKIWPFSIGHVIYTYEMKSFNLIS